MTSIFVAKLDFGVTSEQLKSTFEQYGKVLKASVATDRETGKSRGFGFVEMEDQTEARNAISALDNYQFNGRPISVKEAEPRESRPPREQGARPPFAGNGERKPFQRNDTPSRPSSAPSRPQVNTSALTPEDFTKLASQGSEKPKKAEKKKKNGSMEAYKKSGKTPRYDLDDDMDDWRPAGGKKSNSQFEEDDDDEF
jgi:RNA recognition motif-containing protein